ncbi:DUF5994 family protein [Jiangella anatolica]|uniref:Uncharacterized protein n=1 Tax=Jiangella anatolica TaxID=2670374 RepID=A0A2W2BKM5_9ACTN|nr:DUF5994 family protein [Jiangella anatolica]PZF80858.1 hypothetical protein C1I92_23750 [Jiangella anatolica]
MFSPIIRGDVRAVDGAWWPRSRDLAAELPALLAALSRRGLEVARVAYHRDSWDGQPSSLPVAGGIVRLGWFRTIDPHLVSITGLDIQDRQDLLVIAATSDPRLAARVFDWIQDGHHHHRRASTILTAAEASLQPPAPRSAPVIARPDLAESTWESEGGSRRRALLNTGTLT